MTSLYAVAPTAAAQDQEPSASPAGHCLGITFYPPDRPPVVCTVATGEETRVSPVAEDEAALYVGVVELLTEGGQRVPMVSAGEHSPCEPWEAVEQVDCVIDEPPIPVEIGRKGTTTGLCLQEVQVIIDYDTDGDEDANTGALTTC